jgi:hypothetical protein
MTLVPWRTEEEGLQPSSAVHDFIPAFYVTWLCGSRVSVNAVLLYISLLFNYCCATGELEICYTSSAIVNGAGGGGGRGGEVRIFDISVLSHCRSLGAGVEDVGPNM